MMFQPRCGLPISTYFSALKIKWLMENCPDVVKAIEEGNCLFGTVDTWLIWVCRWSRDSYSGASLLWTPLKNDRLNEVSWVVLYVDHALCPNYIALYMFLCVFVQTRT